MTGVKLNSGPAVAISIERAADASLARSTVVLKLPTLTCWSSKVCFAVIATSPLASVTVPLVVMTTVVPEAVALPINTPSANSSTVAPDVTPLTSNWSVFPAVLLRFVRLSELLAPVS